MHKPIPHFQDSESTWVGKIKPEDLTEEEHIKIKKGILGYCEGHRVLYKKWALGDCMIPAIFPDGLGRECKEWPSRKSGRKMSDGSDPVYDGYRWIGTKHVWRDEKLYCGFCGEEIVFTHDPYPKGTANILLDEEEFDIVVACHECCERIIGDLYPPREKILEAAKTDGFPSCEKCGNPVTPSFMHGQGLLRDFASCCGEMRDAKDIPWPYKATEAVYKTSPIWKSFFALRGAGGIGENAARIIFHERRIKEIKKEASDATAS